MSAPRASTEQEDASLLDPTTSAQPADSEPSYKRNARALTLTEKILAVLSIIFLLLTATFVGLFAGTAVQLKKARHQSPEIVTSYISRGHGHPTATVTVPGHGQKPFPGPTGKPKHPDEPEEKTCLTRECILLASDLLQNIDESVDPCDDFYAYANGGWLKTHSIPSDRGVYGSFNALQDSNRKIILEVLEEENEKPKKDDSREELAEKENLAKLRRGYRACLDEGAINKQGIEPLLSLTNSLTDILGPFVVPELQEAEVASDDDVEEADEEELEEFDWADGKGDVNRYEALTEALAFTHTRGVDALVNFAIEGDAGGEDPQLQALFFYQSGGGLPSKEYYEEKPILSLYTSVVADVLHAIAYPKHPKKKEVEDEGFPWPKPGGGGQDGSVKKQKKAMKVLARKVVRLERELVRAGADPENLSNPSLAYNPYPFNNLSQELSFFSLPEYLSAYSPRSFPESIVVTYPPYISSVRKILSSTPDHVLSAYFVTRMGLSYSKFLGPATEVKIATRKLQVALQGLKPGVPEDRQQFCQSYADELEGLGLIGGKEFVEKTFGGNSKQKAEAVIYNIIDAFKARLPSVPWMDKESAAAAAKKAETLLVKIGYPTTPNTTDALALKAYYSRLTIDDEFFANGLRQRMLSEIRGWAKLGRRRDRGEWEMQPQLVNAYYSPPDGEIVFPAGILRSPFFSAEWPLHLQYGAFGSVAAHELSHAFDNTGAQYDSQGRLRDWWTNSTVKAFREKAQCVAQQYSKYSIPGPDGKPVYINGNLTNGEDLGDSGIVFAYNAWKNASSEIKTEKLPGLNFTDEQLFFLASGRVWAQLIKPQSALARIRTDPHSPNEWRSNGQLRGFKKFAEAFKCKAGSPMNPKERCDVW